MSEEQNQTDHQDEAAERNKPDITSDKVMPPIPNYTLSTVCPACGAPTFRRACKVCCDRCGFAWDCSEL
jgi:hypothetical protein